MPSLAGNLETGDDVVLSLKAIRCRWTLGEYSSECVDTPSLRSKPDEGRVVDVLSLMRGGKEIEQQDSCFWLSRLDGVFCRTMQE